MWLLLRLVAYTGGALLLSVLAVLLYVTFFPKRVHELKGLCCAVTGASDGLGVFIAHALAAEGVEKLVLGARRVEKLEEVKADLVKRFPKVKVLMLKLDVTDGESRNDFLRQATTFGPCQVLINNAGVMTSCFFESFPTDALDAMLQTNLCGTLHLTKRFLPELFKQKKAHVVNISSITSKLPVPYSSIYAATKAALSSFTLSLRLEMLVEQSPVTVHCVSPGLVKDTGLAERACQNTGPTIEESGKNVGYTTPEEVARAVVRAIQYDEAEVVVNSNRLQLLFALAAFFPSFWEIATPMMEKAGLESTKNLRKGAEQTLLAASK